MSALKLIQENEEKLAQCDVPHDFNIVKHNDIFGNTYHCTKCDGFVTLSQREGYVLALEHVASKE